MKFSIVLLILLFQQARGDCPCMAGTYDVTVVGTSQSASNALLLVQPVSGVWHGTYQYHPLSGCDYAGEWDANITGLIGFINFVTVSSCSCNGSPCFNLPPGIEVTIDPSCLSFTELWNGVTLAWDRRVVGSCAATNPTASNTLPTDSTSTSVSTSTGSTSASVSASTDSTMSTAPTTTRSTTNPCPVNCICSINPLAYINPNQCVACKEGFKNIFSDCTDVSTACSKCKSIFQGDSEITKTLIDAIQTGSCLNLAWGLMPQITSICVPLTAATGEVGLPMCDLVGGVAVAVGCKFLKKYIPVTLGEAGVRTALQGLKNLGKLVCTTPQLGFCAADTAFKAAARGNAPTAWSGDLNLALTSGGAWIPASRSEINISQTHNKLRWSAQNDTKAGQGYRSCYSNNTGSQYQFADNAQCLQHAGECQVATDVLSAFLQSLAQLSSSVVFGTPVQTGASIVQNWTVTPLPLVPGLEVANSEVPPFTLQYVTDLNNQPISISIVDEGMIVGVSNFELFEPQSDFDIDLPADAASCQSDDKEEVASAASAVAASSLSLLAAALILLT